MGYALEVTREILSYAFNELGVDRVVSETQTANKLPCKLLNKLGMKIVESVDRFGVEQHIFALDNPKISIG